MGGATGLGRGPSASTGAATRRRWCAAGHTARGALGHLDPIWALGQDLDRVGLGNCGLGVGRFHADGS
jgi:hypothetical protein